MKKGYLSEYFAGVAAKRLSAVEADFARSHQHEFNGVEALKRIFGAAPETRKLGARFIYINDHDAEPVMSDGFLTWYDARERHPTRSEHRMYFPTTEVSMMAAEGDLLVIGLRQDGSVLVIIAEGASTVANQIRWLFGFSEEAHPGFSIRAETESDQVKLEFASRLILDELGIEQGEEDNAPNFLDIMLARFGSFPPTRDFSDFARGTLKDVSPLDNPDAALMAWMEREEILFRTLERHLIGERLRKGFENDVEGFISFSLSVQNRRKSRVGSALENHVEEVLRQRGIRYDRGKVTENKSRPDFIFPGINEYHDVAFPQARLAMLGVKSSCKDRWRQVLAEAARIDEKHLLTLEPGISTNQTDEMHDRKLRLVLPWNLHQSYLPAQRKWLMTFDNFLSVISERQ
jgi:hypothetical protein